MRLETSALCVAAALAGSAGVAGACDTGKAAEKTVRVPAGLGQDTVVFVNEDGEVEFRGPHGETIDWRPAGGAGHVIGGDGENVRILRLGGDNGGEIVVEIKGEDGNVLRVPGGGVFEFDHDVNVGADFEFEFDNEFEFGEGVHAFAWAGPETNVTVFGEPGQEMEVEVVESRPARLGVTLGEVSDAVASQLGVDKGKVVLITGVMEGMPAETAGLKRFDIITGVDDHESVTPDTLREIVFSRKPGDAVTLRVLRKGDVQTIKVRLADGGQRGPVIIERRGGDGDRAGLEQKLRTMRDRERDAVQTRERAVERVLRERQAVERSADARRLALDRLREESRSQGGQFQWRSEQFEDVRKQLGEQLKGMEGRIDADTRRSIEEAMERVREAMKDLDRDLPRIEIFREGGGHEALILPPPGGEGRGEGRSFQWVPAPDGRGGRMSPRQAPRADDERNRNLNDRLNGLEDRMDRIERLLERLLEQRG